MTDSDDKLSRRYRELAREEPSADLDAAVLAASRRAAEHRGRTPESAREGSRKTGARPQWMVPTSIAAVLVLGIGVSLRMQMEQPGIETSAPSHSAEYPVLEPAEPAPPPAKEEPPAKRQDAAPRAGARAQPEAKTRVLEPERQLAKSRMAEGQAAPKEPRSFADAPLAIPQVPAPVPAAPPAIVLAAPAPAAVPERLEPPPAAAPAQERPAAPFPGTISHAPPRPTAESAPAQAAAAPKADANIAAPAAAGAPAAPQPQMRAKREAAAADNALARESRALGAAAETDPVRELERIARLREAGRNDEADRALAEFRRRHPDFRIPEATWERVRRR